MANKNAPSSLEELRRKSNEARKGKKSAEELRVVGKNAEELRKVEKSKEKLGKVDKGRAEKRWEKLWREMRKEDLRTAGNNWGEEVSHEMRVWEIADAWKHFFAKHSVPPWGLPLWSCSDPAQIGPAMELWFSCLAYLSVAVCNSKRALRLEVAASMYVAQFCSCMLGPMLFCN